MRSGMVMLAALAAYAISAFAVDMVPAPESSLETIVVTGKKLSLPDAEVKEQVEAAMRSDPYFPDQHVVVTIKDGVVTLHGIVFDDWDLRMAKRIAKRAPGVKRVIDDLEISVGGE